MERHTIKNLQASLLEKKLIQSKRKHAKKIIHLVLVDMK